MKKFLHLIHLILMFTSTGWAQVLTPIATGGYNLDAVAENTTAIATTQGAIDASDYVMYSAAYGSLYSVANGLPNNGIIASGTRTYQLQSYTAPNVLYVMAGFTDTIVFSTPASYAGISLLGFATEGNGTLDLTLEFTDNTSQFYSAQTFPDWFGTGNTVLTGFDRATRSSGTPANISGNPKMFYLDLPVLCANRTKSVSRLLVHNTGTNARLVIMAVSGAAAPSFSHNSQPVTCVGGTNGSASITATGGIPPYTYTWSTTPVQNTAQASNLGTGTYTYSAQDNGGCIVTATVPVGQNLIPEPSLTLAATAGSLCSGGNLTLTSMGAASYSWTNGPAGQIYSPGPLTVNSTSVFTYSVSGHTSVNCLRTGSISITVHPLPNTSFIGQPGPYCTNTPSVNLNNSVQQPGGIFTGLGVNNGLFNPSIVGTGTYLITYSRTENNCASSSTISVQVFSLAAPQLQAPPALCSNGTTIAISASPAGGTFTGSGTGNNGIFDPSISGAGTHPVQYSISSGVCTASSQVLVTVNQAPTASITGKNFFCTTHSSAFFNGQPAGGSFSGPGLAAGLFSPAKANIGNNNIIIYSYTDLNGCSDTASLRVTVSLCAGIEDSYLSRNHLTVYPNPSRENITLRSESDMEIGIYNDLGQIILIVNLNSTNDHTHVISDLPVGSYYAKSVTGQGPVVKILVSD